MRCHIIWAMLSLTCCGGIVVVDGSSGDAGQGASGTGGAANSSGVGTSGTGAGAKGGGGSGGGISDPEWCNMAEGPLPEDDGDPLTYPCQWWQDCCLVQGSGSWQCMKECL
jgi:hypothetical protein